MRKRYASGKARKDTHRKKELEAKQGTRHIHRSRWKHCGELPESSQQTSEERDVLLVIVTQEKENPKREITTWKQKDQVDLLRLALWALSSKGTVEVARNYTLTSYTYTPRHM
jgi:hypothetical protein